MTIKHELTGSQWKNLVTTNEYDSRGLHELTLLIKTKYNGQYYNDRYYRNLSLGEYGYILFSTSNDLTWFLLNV